MEMEQIKMDIKDYKHKVHYYETDKMGVVHHSNYIKWMEEARIDFMDKLGFGYKCLEEIGIISPVTGVECHFKKPSGFDDIIDIQVSIKLYNGIKMSIGYTMINSVTGDIIAEGESSHCFINNKGKLVNLKKECPELNSIFEKVK